MYFHLNLKWHCLHLKGISDPLKPLCPILNFLLLCPKVLFLDKSKITFYLSGWYTFEAPQKEWFRQYFEGGFVVHIYMCVLKLYFWANIHRIALLAHFIIQVDLILPRWSWMIPETQREPWESEFPACLNHSKCRFDLFWTYWVLCCQICLITVEVFVG